MNYTPANFKILIVDDNLKNIQILGSVLKSEGYSIEFALNGVQAIKHVASSPFDLILLDIMMPEMDGKVVCAEIRSHKKYDDIPIIFLTANSEKEDVIEGFKLGAQDYIVKPFDQDELLVRVKTQLELKYRREQLKELNKQLSELNATKDMFFSIIAHDLKTPFFVLTSYSEKLAKMLSNTSNPELKDTVKILNEASGQGKTLLNNLLQWAMAQTGRLEFYPEPLTLRELTTQVCQMVKPHADSKNIQMSNSIEAHLVGYGDKNMMEVVLFNLLSNAIKFTPAGGKIEVSVEQSEDQMRVSVADNGVGISAENISKIFSIEKKHKTAGTAGEQGSGLGLIACKEFVKLNKGELDVKSELGKGTTFSFTLPMMQVAQKE